MSVSEPATLPWSAGQWNNEPAAVAYDGDDLLVTAVESSDAWRLTSYGFIHDTEHALLAPFSPGTAIEVEYTARFSEQFDQAGLFISASPEKWVKAGTEFADGLLSAGAVVTDNYSDWSLSPALEWLHQRVLIRASWADDAITLRGGIVGQPLRLLRVFPFASSDTVKAGPMICAPTRAGLTVPFHAWRITPADKSLH